MGAETTLRMILLGEDRSAGKALKGVGDQAEKSSSKLDKMHKVGHAAGLALAGGLTLAGVAAVKATKAAAEDQLSTEKMAQTFRKAAGASREQIAATEDWITAQGKAKGVADDELRPALSKLVVATGSVAKAQKLASLAMDVSAGTGKSLESVSFALAKAQNGNVSGLSRLGVQTTKTTKDTEALAKAQTASKSAALAYSSAVKSHGKNSIEASIALDKLKQANDAVRDASSKTKKETLSLDQITKNLSQTYGGAAAKSAETAAGKQKILTVQMGELQEQIGYALLPAMSKLVSVGIQVTGWVSRNTTTVGVLVGVIAGLVAVTWAVGAATKAWFAITKLMTAAQIVFTNAQWALNIAMEANPIGVVILGLTLLVGGLILAYKKSETFRNIVNAAFSAVGKAAGVVFSWIKDHWQLLMILLGGAIGAAVVIIIRNWDKVSAAIRAVGKVGVWLWNGVFQPVLKFIVTGISFLIGVWAKMLGALSHVPGFGWAKDAANALQSASDKARSLADGIAKIPTKKTSTVVLNVVHNTVHTTGGRVPGFASGTSFAPGGLALVGEAGPELVNLPRGSQVHTASATRSMLGGSQDLGTFTVVVAGEDGRTIQTKLLKLKRTNGGLQLGLA